MCFVIHIVEGFLPPLQATAWFVATVPFVARGAMAVVKRARKDPGSKLLLATAGVFTFALSAVKLPSITGPSSHPTGTGAEAMLFKPPVPAFLGAIMLLFRAILLAHEGLMTLGASVSSMAIVDPWCGCLMWMLFGEANKMMAVFLTVAVTGLSTYVVVSSRLVITYPGTEGSFGATLVKFMSIFALTQIPPALAGDALSVFLFPFLTRVASSELSELGVLSHKNAETTS